MPSQRQIDANRNNAQNSTGPVTPQGRAAVRFNAIKHGLTAENAVIGRENEEEFNQTLQALEAELQPVGSMEYALLHQIVAATWRLRRLRLTETGFFDLLAKDLTRELREKYTGLTNGSQMAFIVRRDSLGDNTLMKLCRYEAAIEGCFYRALHELQRRQAARAGQDVPLPIVADVDITLASTDPLQAPITKQSPSQNRTPSVAEPTPT